MPTHSGPRAAVAEQHQSGDALIGFDDEHRAVPERLRELREALLRRQMLTIVEPVAVVLKDELYGDVHGLPLLGDDGGRRINDQR